MHPLPYPPSQPGGAAIAASISATQNCLCRLDSQEGAPDPESEGCVSIPPVLSMSAVGTAMVCPFYQCDRAQHSLVKQAEAQGALTAGAVAEVQAGGATRAPLHPDEGLDLGAHLELHYGLDQWPVGTTAVWVLLTSMREPQLSVCPRCLFCWFPSSLPHLESRSSLVSISPLTDAKSHHTVSWPASFEPCPLGCWLFLPDCCGSRP